MTKKILGYVGVLAIGIVLGWVLFHRGSALRGVSNVNSFNFTPSASTGDSYAVAVQGYTVIDMSGHFNATGTKDTVSKCGGGTVSSATIQGANGIGRVTTGGDASSTCTITFGNPFTSTPSCGFDFESSTLAASTSSYIMPASSTLTIMNASSSQFAGQIIDYQCFGNQ